MKRIKLLALFILLFASQLAMANIVSTSSFSLGAMGPSKTKTFGNSFNNLAVFADAYSFSINAPANLSGTTKENMADFWFLPRHIDVLTVSLYDENENLLPVDTSPSSFLFQNLAIGSYTLLVSGNVTPGFGTASYSGTLSSVSAVPVPAAAYLFLSAFLGFLGLRKRSNS
jgi:hypothetical protein